MYRSFLHINFLSFNLRILLYSNHKTDTTLTFDMVPIELIAEDDIKSIITIIAEKKSNDKPWAPLLSKNLNIKDYNKLFDVLFILGAAAIIVEGDYVLNGTNAVYTISSDDIIHLHNIIRNLNNNQNKIVKQTRITSEYSDTITLVDEMFLQIPPILFLVLFVVIWKTFSTEHDYSRESFYNYEDFTDSVNINCQGTFCCICFVEYQSGDEIRKLGCKHYFHKNCIQSWLARSNICPVCRVDVFRAQEQAQTEIAFI